MEFRELYCGHEFIITKKEIETFLNENCYSDSIGMSLFYTFKFDNKLYYFDDDIIFMDHVDEVTFRVLKREFID